MKTRQEITFDLLEETNLNWEVEKRPLYDQFGNETRSFGMFKSKSSEYLGTVGNQYTPLQNWELAELLVEAGQISDTNFTRGGMLKSGEFVYLQAELPDAVVGSDTLKRKLTAMNSHNGTTSIGFGTTNTVVICQNTFHKALRDKGMSKFRHTSNAKERIEALVADISNAVKNEESIVAAMQRMAEIEVKQEPFKRVMNVLFGKEHDLEKVSSRKKNQMNKFAEVMESEIQSHGKTLWGLFNAVTYYTNHVTNKENDGGEYLMVGNGNRINSSSFDAIYKWVEENTGELVLA